MKNDTIYQIIFLSIVFIFIALSAAAKEKDLTSPILTCGVIGQLVQDAAVALGPVLQLENTKSITPDTGSQARLKTSGTNKSGITGKSALPKSKLNKQQQKLAGGTFEPQAHRFSGEQMWGRADVTLVTAARSFDIKVNCTLPVTMWALYADDVQISSASVPNLTAFSFKGNELYTPPYKLVLNVIYMGIPNQIRVELK